MKNFTKHFRKNMKKIMKIFRKNYDFFRKKWIKNAKSEKIMNFFLI